MRDSLRTCALLLAGLLILPSCGGGGGGGNPPTQFYFQTGTSDITGTAVVSIAGNDFSLRLLDNETGFPVANATIYVASDGKRALVLDPAPGYLPQLVKTDDITAGPLTVSHTSATSAGAMVDTGPYGTLTVDTDLWDLLVDSLYTLRPENSDLTREEVVSKLGQYDPFIDTLCIGFFAFRSIATLGLSTIVEFVVMNAVTKGTPIAYAYYVMDQYPNSTYDLYTLQTIIAAGACAAGIPMPGHVLRPRQTVATPSPGSGIITGTVTVSSTPAAGASITAFPLGHNFTETSTSSDTNGLYFLPNLPEGTYRVVFEHPSAQVASADALVQLSGGATVTLDQDLVPLLGATLSVQPSVIEVRPSATTYMEIHNRGVSQTLAWTLSGLPTWCSASTTSGTVVPGGVEVVTLTTDATASGQAIVTIDSTTTGETVQVMLRTRSEAWTITAAPPIAAREHHTAVWTGTEMILWGGQDGAGPPFADGARYDPAANSWTPMASSPLPGRLLHTAVWTGSEMIVWGGTDFTTRFNDGARYDPSTDTWNTISAVALVGRERHTAVWTGTEMIVWGGSDGTGSPTHLQGDGGRYDPATNSWSAVSSGIAARVDHTAVWSGTEMILWGGQDSNGSPYVTNSGGRYNPANDTWAPTSLTAAPALRRGHTAVWTGTEMIIWGGGEAQYANTGGRYSPIFNSWSPTKVIEPADVFGNGNPKHRNDHTAVWTGSEMIVFGGSTTGGIWIRHGSKYSPGLDSWNNTSLLTERVYHTAIWTGTQMIVWGGFGFGSQVLSDGGVYNP